MTPYPTYKPSGISWIGDIPEHWEVKKVKHLADVQGRIGFKGYSVRDIVQQGEGALTLGAKHINKKNKLDLSDPEYLSWEKYYESPEIFVEQGHVLVTQRGSLGKVAVIEENIGRATINPSMAILKNIADNPKYIFWVLNATGFLSFIDIVNSATAVPMISQEQLSNFQLALPPPSEQTAIANYLDKKTTAIDELIADKEQLLKLYEEEKTALINHAVTKGLNPDAPMKDSGIAWLGEIPEHWEVKKLKYVVVKIGSGVTPSGGASVYQLSGIPLLRSQNIYFDGLKLDDVAYITPDIHDKMSNSKVFSGDVLLNITGASIGRSYYVEDWLGEANVNQHVCIIRPKQNISTKFLYFLLRSNIGQEQITNEQTGSGREGLNFESLKNFKIPFLEPEEQQSIVDYIETECSKIDAQVARTRKLIELLTEYRTALISEVVTGKIKVTD